MANTKTPLGLEFEAREILDKLGVSQRKLAKLLGRGEDWVGRIVRGLWSPSWGNACVIAKALGVSVGVFLRGDPARKAFFLYGKQEIIDTLGTNGSGNTSSPKPRRKKGGGKTVGVID